MQQVQQAVAEVKAETGIPGREAPAEKRPLMTVPEVAESLGYARQTVWRRAKRGEFDFALVLAGRDKMLFSRAKLAERLGVDPEDL